MCSRTSTGPKLGSSRHNSSNTPAAPDGRLRHRRPSHQLSPAMRRWLDESDPPYVHAEPSEVAREPAAIDLSSATESQPTDEGASSYTGVREISCAYDAVRRDMAEADLLYVGAFAGSAEAYPPSISMDHLSHLQSLSSGLKMIVSNTADIISRLDSLVENMADVDLI